MTVYIESNGYKDTAFSDRTGGLEVVLTDDEWWHVQNVLAADPDAQIDLDAGYRVRVKIPAGVTR